MQSTLPLSLKQLQAFVSVATQLHFGHTAEQLYTSQSSVTRSVSSVERAVGAQLLERSTRRVQLTAAGQAFYEKCSRALDLLNLARSDALGASSGTLGRIDVGYMNFAIRGLLPGLLRKYTVAFPNVALHVEYAPSAEQYERLRAGLLDVAFAIYRPHGTDLRSLPVQRNRYVALLPIGHPLARREELHLSDLGQERFIFGAHSTFGTFLELLQPIFRRAGIVPRVVQDATNTTGIFGLVEAGMGISIYVDCVLRSQPTGLVVKPLSDVPDEVVTSMVWSAARPRPVLANFLSFMRDVQDAG